MKWSSTFGDWQSTKLKKYKLRHTLHFELDFGDTKCAIEKNCFSVILWTRQPKSVMSLLSSYRFQAKDELQKNPSTENTLSSNADVTLNMLNATSETDVDVEGLGPPSAHF